MGEQVVLEILLCPFFPQLAGEADNCVQGELQVYQRKEQGRVCSLRLRSPKSDNQGANL